MRRTVLLIVITIVIALPSVIGAEDALVTQFTEPQVEYSPVPIWWWSGDPIEPETIRYQLKRLAEGGIHNAMILNLAPSGPLYGSAPDDPPFLSERWWELFDVALHAGKEFGVRLWFYDQLGFSGAGLQARIVRDHPEFRGINLNREVRDMNGPAEVSLPVPPGGSPLAAFTAECLDTEKTSVSWIWDGDALGAEGKRYFRRTFQIDEIPKSATLRITCNDAFRVFVNGTLVGDDFDEIGRGFRSAEEYEVSQYLQKNKNAIAVEGENLGGAAFLLLELQTSTKDSEPTEQRLVVSDDRFKVSVKVPNQWEKTDFDDSTWKNAYCIPERLSREWGPIAGFDLGTSRRIRNVQNVTNQIVNETLRVTIPAGRHSVQLYYTEPGGFDYQNPQAGEALLNIVHGEFERRFASELGKAIAGSFQDEFPALPRFSNRFPDEFKARMGYDLLERLPALYDDVEDLFEDVDGPTSIQIRCAANDVAAQLCEEAFFIPLQEWHDKYGMLCGYDQTVRNADPLRGESYYVDYFKTMRHYSAPGNDQDGDSKAHGSIADLYNRPRVWIESFHSSGWGQTLEEINTLLNPWLVDGANLYNPHAVYYSIHGSYWEWAPPDTGWRQPYFVHNEVFADHISRLTSILSKGRHVVHTAVLHPATTIHGDTGFGSGGTVASDASTFYWRVQTALREQTMDFIVIDEDSISRASITKDGMVINDLNLRVLILPATKILHCSTLEKLVAFVNQGGTVLLLGNEPEIPADTNVEPLRFKELSNRLREKAHRVNTAAEVVENVQTLVTRDLLERLPALHRKIGDRNFFFIQSDPETKADGGERWAINKRLLWTTQAARGERIPVHLAADGIPERWNTLTGKVEPIFNYRRQDGSTRVDIELADTPAPLIALRPVTGEAPLAIESALNILSWQKDDRDDAIKVRAIQRMTQQARPTETESVVMEFEDGLYQGSTPLKAMSVMDIPGPMECRLLPTCDNTFGDFAWPPSKGPIPIEIRAMRFNRESKTTDATDWMKPDFNDGEWPLAIASFGPRAEWTGPLTLKDNETFTTLKSIPKITEPMKPAVYSLQLGLNEDPVFRSALGGKGRIPEEFIDLGTAQAGEVYLVRAVVVARIDEPLDCLLRVGGTSQRRVFFNDREIAFEGDMASRRVRAKVQLQPGANRLDVLLSREANGTIRFFYHFLPPEGVPQDPEWIWSHRASPSGKSLFTKTIQIPDEIQSAAMIVALGDLHQIRINGKRVADQGNFDPYFTSRAEQYDITAFLQKGDNLLEVETRDLDEPTGLFIDGQVVLQDGREIPFVSDSTFKVRAVEDAPERSDSVRILSEPAHAYMGDPSLMLLHPRPHPLPFAGWLAEQAPPAKPFTDLISCRSTENLVPGWYRFRVPPGATALSLKSPGRLDLYINGARVSFANDGIDYRADLPDPTNPERIAAIRIEPVAGFEEGAALLEPIRFEVGRGRMPFGSWHELGLPHYCGGMSYEIQLELSPSENEHHYLDLGRVRGTAEVIVNGKACGIRLWHPYRFEITDALQAGTNHLEVHVYNTLGPHFDIGHPGGHVYENHTVSGVLGPVQILGVSEMDIRLKKKL